MSADRVRPPPTRDDPDLDTPEKVAAARERWRLKGERLQAAINVGAGLACSHSEICTPYVPCDRHAKELEDTARARAELIRTIEGGGR